MERLDDIADGNTECHYENPISFTVCELERLLASFYGGNSTYRRPTGKYSCLDGAIRQQLIVPQPHGIFYIHIGIPGGETFVASTLVGSNP